MEITLEDLLLSRDERHSLQQEILAQHPVGTLLCLTVIMPGNVKRNLHSLIVAQAAVTAVLGRLGDHIKWSHARDLTTGYEAYFVVDMSAREAKLAACSIEDSHPLGRLFDIDVLTPQGDGAPLSRREVGCAPRRCLLCGNEARWCMRNHTHSTQQLQSHIQQMVEAYVQ